MSVWGRRVEVLLDVIAAATVVGSFAGGLAAPALGAVLGVVMVAALSLRRQVPVVAGAVGVVASAAAIATPEAALTVWVLAEVALFSVALRRSRVAAIVLGVLHIGVLYAGALVGLGLGPGDPVSLLLPVWTAAVIAFGVAVRVDGQFQEVARRQILDAARVREGEILQRVGRERLGIARDLHDSVANSIAVISLHSSAAERALGESPEKARAALRIVRETSRAVLAEVEEILAVLRDGTASSDRLDVASAANIPDLVATLADGGMRVSAEVPPLPPLDPLVDTAAFRIVQEALTNAQKHGDGAVSVRVAIEPTDLVVSVRNPLRVAAGRVDAARGFGLVGMRERAELAGGTLHTRSGAGDFVVTARLPLGVPHPRGRDVPVSATPEEGS